jgi:hypothetical protein
VTILQIFYWTTAVGAWIALGQLAWRSPEEVAFLILSAVWTVVFLGSIATGFLWHQGETFANAFARVVVGGGEFLTVALLALIGSVGLVLALGVVFGL